MGGMVRLGLLGWAGAVLVACGGKGEAPPEVAPTRPAATDDKAEQEEAIAKLRAKHPEPSEPGPSEPPPPEPEPTPSEPPPAEPAGARADLRTWKVRYLKGFARELPMVVFTGSAFITVGDEGAVFDSPDGRDWYARAVETGSALRAVARSADGVIAVLGERGYHARTNDAFEGWRIGTTDLQADALFAVGANLVAIGSGRAWLSQDGAAWQEHTVEGLEGDVVAVGREGALVALGHDGASQELVVRTTTDGVTWSSARVAEALVPRDLAYGRDRYWLVGNTPRGVRVSEDLNTFTSVKLPGKAEALGIAASESGVVVVGRGGFIAVSEDGESFTVIDPPTEEQLTDVACSPSVCAAVGSAGRLVTTESLPVEP
ncbi:MAG: hypothetical protein IT385_30980 [Deltaproteobacteria bacterium]|nr:hypothetical protein [Deltaproteobacteria bacterium]